jgi:hypothetical protein
MTARPASCTAQHRALLGLAAPALGRSLSEAVLSDAGIVRCASLAFGGNFGAGLTWGHASCGRAGVEVYQQRDGSTALVPWSTVRAVRDQAPAGALAELASAVEFYAAGPRYRGYTLPAHLRPESPECRAMAPAALAAARAEVHDVWRRDVDVPFRDYYDRASARLQAALTTVLTLPTNDEPVDLLEMLAALEGTAA